MYQAGECGGYRGYTMHKRAEIRNEATCNDITAYVPVLSSLVTK